jgi:hypothetical protein
MKQQAAIFALEGLKNYDKKRPLENFLWTHVRNRLFNYKRNNYQRPDKPCLTCPFFAPKSCASECSEFSNKEDCSLFSSWTKRNDAKKNIMKPIGIDSVSETSREINYGQLFQDISNKEILNIIDGAVKKTENMEAQEEAAQEEAAQEEAQEEAQADDSEPEPKLDAKASENKPISTINSKNIKGSKLFDVNQIRKE